MCTTKCATATQYIESQIGINKTIFRTEKIIHDITKIYCAGNNTRIKTIEMRVGTRIMKQLQAKWNVYKWVNMGLK